MYIPEIYDGLEKATPFKYGPFWYIYIYKISPNVILQKGGLGRYWDDQLGLNRFFETRLLHANAL